MTPRYPPRALEVLVAALLPASRREELLGDLCERYTSTWRFILDAVQIVPAAALGHLIRRQQRAAIQRQSAPTAALAICHQNVRERLATSLASSRVLGAVYSRGVLGTVVWCGIVAVHSLLAADASDGPPE